MTDARATAPTGPPDGITPSATVGPYFAYGLSPMGRYAWKDTGTPTIAPPGTVGIALRIEGRIVDGDGAGVPDAMLEIWQADASGRYNTRALDGAPTGTIGHNAPFTGWGRVETTPEGHFQLTSIKPGQVDAHQAPHLLVALFARGMLRHLYTRIYFAEDVAQHISDPVLQAVPADRRATLIAARDPSSGTHHFDIRIQGGAETVFFDL